MTQTQYRTNHSFSSMTRNCSSHVVESANEAGQARCMHPTKNHEEAAVGTRLVLSSLASAVHVVRACPTLGGIEHDYVL